MIDPYHPSNAAAARSSNGGVGVPARTATTSDTAGTLHIDFAAVRPGELEHISWQEWFTAFDARGLALCYPDPHLRGGASAWFELVPRGGGIHP